MFDLLSCEIQLLPVDATGADHKPLQQVQFAADRSLGPFDDFEFDDDIDQSDDAVKRRIDDAIQECQILRRQTTACEMSTKNGSYFSLHSVNGLWNIKKQTKDNENFNLFITFHD